MCELFSASTYFFAALTVVVFALASACQKKLKLVIFNPVLVSVLVIIGLLAVLDIPYAVYQESCRILSYLLTPATICLAISFYEQIDRLKKHLLPIMIGVLCGVLCSITAYYSTSFPSSQGGKCCTQGKSSFLSSAKAQAGCGKILQMRRSRAIIYFGMF